MTNQEFQQLQQALESCRLCSEKFDHAPRPIVWGNQSVKIFQISQAPSMAVHDTGKPFNDQSGKKLRRDWLGITDEQFYHKDLFYLSSIGHCFPGKNKSGGDKLPPKICADTWLKRELDAVENEMYLIIGSKAAARLFPKEEFNKLVFFDQKLRDKPAYVLPHPSPLNIKWFQDHPAFLEERLPQIRCIVQSVLGLAKA